MRQIALDTETTGLRTTDGHRIIEIGCVEMIDRRLTGNQYHQYINPEREIDKGAFAVHGLGNDMLADKPVFADVCDEFLEFIQDAELIIHNAPFDVGFLDSELRRLGKRPGKINKYSTIFDTLTLARRLHPGQKNNLDALCRRYQVDNTHRSLHGALLDAKILSQVYLLMTGGQESLFAEEEPTIAQQKRVTNKVEQVSGDRQALPVIQPNKEELAAHNDYLKTLKEKSGVEYEWEDNS